MYQQPPQNDPYQQGGFQSPRQDGAPVVQQASTYMTDPDAERVCEIFAEGLDSGLGYTRIMSFLERKGVKPDIISKMQRALVEDGVALSEAFARYGILDSAARKLILVAERQGTLPDAFRTLVPIYRNRYERKKQVLNTFVEPVILFYLSVFILLPVMSNISEIYEHRSGIMAGVMEFALGPMTFGLFAVFGIILCGFAWLMMPVDSSLREAASSMWMRMPVISQAARLAAASLFARYLGTSIGGGMNIFDSIQLAAEACNEPRINDGLPHAFGNLERGLPLSESLCVIKAIPEDIIEYINLGEETGRMEDMLERGADLLEKQAEEAFEKQMKAFTNILRMVLIFGVLGSVVFKMIGNLTGTFNDALEGTYVLPFIWAHARLRVALTSRLT